MYLERAKILNFRGIRRLKVDFEEDSTLLIGENHWGKTSLLRALWMLLGRGEQLCEFEKSDLYVPVKLDSLESFPEENLVEKVCGRKVVNFEDLSPAHASSSKPRHKNSLGGIAGRLKSFVPFYRKKDPSDNFNYQEVTAYEDFNQDDLIFFENKHHRHHDLAESSEPDSSAESWNDSDLSDDFSLTDGHIRIDLYFKESSSGFDINRYELLKPFWYYCDDGAYRIHWKINAFFNSKTNRFETEHDLILARKKKENFSEKDTDLAVVKDAILLLIRLNPIYRLRDSRMDNPIVKADIHGSQEMSTIISLMNNDSALSGFSVKKMSKAFESFFDRYLTSYAQNELNLSSAHGSRKVDDFINKPVSLESLSKIRSRLLKPGINRSKALASYIIASMIMARGQMPLSKDSRPIIIFEDIESRFHPSMLLSLWSLIQTSNAQKIVTTNSGDLLSAATLSSLRRLHRKRYDTECFKIDRNTFNSDELRHIAFHIRLNRPIALFARTWILVEGETEVWVLNQVASLLGLSLACEGIRIIEFAQCGLKPLLKIAMALGINFHVLTDGDEAGNKYAQTVRKFVQEKDLEHHLTVLPCRDIEHYLFAQGYEEVFRAASGNINVSNLKKSLAADRIIASAIKKKSKPLLALLLVEAIEKKGLHGVPLAFATLLEEARKLGSQPFL